MQSGVNADDDGFVNNAKQIKRMIGASDDDLKLLIVKRFIIPFDTGVIVIRHWHIHNQIRKDRYKPTIFMEEMKQLCLIGTGEYELAIESGDIVGLLRNCHVINANNFKIPIDLFLDSLL